MVKLRCSVRNCNEILVKHDRAMICARGHNFDIARAGYINLLQPQDRRAKHPGDTQAAVTARARFIQAGHEAPFLTALSQYLIELKLPNNGDILDVGCGTGIHLATIAETLKSNGYGLDISTPAIEKAAKTFTKTINNLQFIIANGDRLLPFVDDSFDLIMSITARKNAEEFYRVIKKDGLLVIVVPGADDLIELRSAIMEEGTLRSREDRVQDIFKDRFKITSSTNINYQVALDEPSIKDLALLTYRGARHRENEKLSSLTSLKVTLSRDLFILRPY